MSNLPKPTLEEILDLLPIAADRGWTINSSAEIRDENGFCPLCALAHEIDPRVTETIFYWNLLAGAVDNDDVAEAADYSGRNGVRDRLKIALGLK